MEMSLHPASLGNVRIQVAARDGVVTANFLTQNEQVKAVLESQLVELKQSMNEQGIKVEAIEVSVAAHAFEENLSKEGDNSSEYEAREGRKRRSINLNEIDDSDDIDIDGDDEIRIAREMMMANGNSVDYMA
jgi:flagellar hook-length control protein FliK